METSGICISRPPAPGPRPPFVFTGPDPQFLFTGPGPNLHLPALAPNLYLPAQPRLSLDIPTLSPQFVFTGPGLRFVPTQACILS